MMSLPFHPCAKSRLQSRAGPSPTPTTGRRQRAPKHCGVSHDGIHRRHWQQQGPDGRAGQIGLCWRHHGPGLTGQQHPSGPRSSPAVLSSEQRDPGLIDPRGALQCAPHPPIVPVVAKSDWLGRRAGFTHKGPGKREPDAACSAGNQSRIAMESSNGRHHASLFKARALIPGKRLRMASSLLCRRRLTGRTQHPSRSKDA
jgi:hypothetical protein